MQSINLAACGLFAYVVNLATALKFGKVVPSQSGIERITVS